MEALFEWIILLTYLFFWVFFFFIVKGFLSKNDLSGSKKNPPKHPNSFVILCNYDFIFGIERLSIHDSILTFSKCFNLSSILVWILMLRLWNFSGSCRRSGYEQWIGWRSPVTVQWNDSLHLATPCPRHT